MEVQLRVVAALNNSRISGGKFLKKAVQAGKDFYEENPGQLVFLENVHEQGDTVVVGIDPAEDRSLRINRVEAGIFPSAPHRAFCIDGDENLNHLCPSND